MRAKIAGLGAFLPEKIRTNADWPEGFAGKQTSRYGSELNEVAAASVADPCDAIVARHLAKELDDPFRGATRRRVADPQMSSAEAEAIAGRRAIADAGLDPREIDLVLSWAMVPDRVTPPTAPRVAHLVGATRAAGIGFDVACATAIAQMMLGAAMIESGRARHVLLTQSHLIARANPLDHPTSPLVGDAASAMVLGPAERAGVGVVHMISHGEYHEAVTWARGRDEAEPPWWEAGAEYTPGTRNREQAKMLGAKLVHFGRDTIAELLDRAHQTIESVDVLACTQARKWFPAAVAESVGLAPSKAPDTFDELAHVGGCGVVINLIEARNRGLLKPGARAMLYGMGAGVTRAAALIDW
ncbi:MAG: 3-oxoacyl-[acyl-carrier-protein] synthase III C-terminal domain-containing protein [Polyangiaceae bacterium]